MLLCLVMAAVRSGYEEVVSNGHIVVFVVLTYRDQFTCLPSASLYQACSIPFSPRPQSIACCTCANVTLAIA